MRIILMVNAIIDRSYSSESSKKHPFSLRATFTAEKVCLEQEVLNQTTQIRMIGNISCSGGGGSVSATAHTTIHVCVCAKKRERCLCVDSKTHFI